MGVFSSRAAGRGGHGAAIVRIALAALVAGSLGSPRVFAAENSAGPDDEDVVHRTVGVGPRGIGGRPAPERESKTVYVPVVLIAVPQPTEPRFSTRAPFATMRAIEAYKQIQAAGGWQPIPDGLELWKGVKGKQVLLLRERLQISGDLVEQSKHPKEYDDVLTQAVARFQARHGLMTTGFVGPDTLMALNVPVGERIRQLEVNLPRLMALQALPSGRSLVVNIPSQELEASENGVLASRHRVVAGKVDRQTPLFQSAVNLVQFNPVWNVPTSIARKDLVPLIQADGEFLEQHNYTVFDVSSGQRVVVDPARIDWNDPNVSNRYRLMQGRGGKNPLGSMVLRFPNPYDVYMHDTSHPELFTLTTRLNSSGCVRIQGVEEVVTWLLRGVGSWDAARVRDAAETVEPVSVQLPAPVPVRTIYITAWADPDGTPQFRDDVYSLDVSAQADLHTSSIASAF